MGMYPVSFDAIYTLFPFVMPALSRSKNGVALLAYVAGIHVIQARAKKTWMAGTSPAMTRK
jgi:hypothetical protein